MLIYSTGLGLGAAMNSVVGILPTSSPASRVCVHDDKGNPVSWSVTDQFATMCHGYTLPELRRKGYSWLVALTLDSPLRAMSWMTTCSPLAS